ncbi:hypothetical protein Dimus_005026 [Dionaea muscipula]
MDFWVVAVAAGAGYLAKYWQKLQNISSDVESLSRSNAGCSTPAESSSLIGQIHDAASPFHKLAKRKLVPEPAPGLLNESFYDRRHNPLSEETHSTSGFTLLSLSNFPDGIPRYKNGQEYVEDIPVDGDIGDSSSKPLKQCPWDTGTSHGFSGGQNSIRSRRTNLRLLKPVNSLESCLMAQLSKEHGQVEQMVFGSIPSQPTPTLRPFYVTDGSRIISKSSIHAFDVCIREGKTKPRKDICCDVNGQMFRTPYLPEIEPAQGPGEQKRWKGENQLGNLISSNILVKDVQCLGQGSPSGAVLFFLGIFVGMLSTIIANKLEVEKLKDLLEQSENLVEDLQEELEMKDSLTVKELVNNHDSLLNSNDCSINKKNLIGHSPQSDPKKEEATKYNSEEANAEEAAEASGKLESITNIEAELEAELERLELNMKESSSQQRLLDLIEVDPDFVAEVVHGELRADIIRAGSGSSSIYDLSSTSTPDATKQAVSPHELCLRLHEFIKSKLEARILELEVALEESQKRVQQLESERTTSWRVSVHSESSSTPDPDSPMARPLVMNLAGEALDAYHEAYEVLGKINVPRQEDIFLELDNQQKVQPFDDGHGRGRLHFFDPNNGHDNETVNGSMQSPVVVEDLTMPNADEEKNSDVDDDDMVLLIRQLVEKAKQGSPAVLHAHRAMISLDTD